MIKYYNLGQCSGHRVVYFRSTDVEQKNWHRLLWSVPDEWFWQWYRGKEIMVIDKSSNKGKIEHIFTPVLIDLLNWLYYKQDPENKNLIAHFQYAVTAVFDDKGLYTRIMFWKRKIKKIKLKAKTIKVKKR